MHGLLSHFFQCKQDYSHVVLNFFDLVNFIIGNIFHFNMNKKSKNKTPYKTFVPRGDIISTSICLKKLM